ncbi:unnamed protein product [Cylicostephanus goldi]|uniref:Uncharacterized protein n=1 Tax=Cylicostephanus goldi TaxID=71465 RepID=A0A3P6R9P2_CYLGO|nr:unnamed protein product [Cylicostephanus goldi]
MSGDFLLVGAGYCALGYLLYKVGLAVYNILWPYIIAPPIDLHAAAGANWAGKETRLPLLTAVSHSLYLLKVYAKKG